MKKRGSQIFFFPDTATGGGDGGGTGTQDKPLDAPVVDVLTFEAGEPLDIDKFISGENEELDPTKPKKEEPPQKKEGEKPLVKKEGEEPPAAKKEEQPPAAHQLRKKYEETKAELDTTKTTFEAEKKSLEEKLAAREKELETIRKTSTEAQTRLEAELSRYNPLANRKLKELEDGFNKDINGALEMIPELTPDGYQTLLRNFMGLDRTSQEKYAAAMKDFKAKVADTFGTDSAQVLELVKKGMKFSNDHASLVKEVQGGAEKLIRQSQVEAWEKTHGDYAKRAAGYLTPPDGAAETDPYHPLFFINAVMPQDPKFGELSKRMTDFAGRVLHGVKPRTAEDLESMGDKERAEFGAKEEQRTTQETQLAERMIVQGGLALAMIRPFFKDYKRLQARLAELGEGAPPDPTKKGGDKKKPGEGGDEPLNLADYEAPAVDDRSMYK